MFNITIEELTRIAGEIEAAPPDDHGDISNAEFAWLYTRGKPLQALKRQTGEIANLLMMGGSGMVFEDYSTTSAIAHLHNHPNGFMQPTMEDLEVLLGGVIRGENLSYALIASTRFGKVTGFYELEYRGKRGNAKSLIKSNLEIYSTHLARKYELLEKHPELLEQMRLGDRILSLDDYKFMVSEAMKNSSIVGRAHPLIGYKFENLRFVSK